MSINKIVEWSGSITGLLGAYFLASTSVYANLGFFGYLISNFCMMIYGIKNKAWGIVTMQVGFTYTTCLGIYNKGWESFIAMVS